MKKRNLYLVIILLFVGMVVFAGCSPISQADLAEQAKKKIVGTWKSDDPQMFLDYAAGILQNFTGINIPSGVVDLDVMIEFREDDTYEMTGAAKVVFLDKFEASIQSGTYTYNNDVLTLVNDKQTMELKVEITDGVMTVLDDSNGRDLKYTFTKQTEAQTSEKSE